MKICPRCGNEVDEEMIICPHCGEILQKPSNKKSSDSLNIHLVRGLALFSVLLPIIGLIVGILAKEKFPMISKILTKFSLYGIIIAFMLLMLALICYLAMTFTGVSYL